MFIWVRGLSELGQSKEKDTTVKGSDAQPTSLRGAWAGLRERSLAAGVCPEALSGCYSEGEEGKKEEDRRRGVGAQVMSFKSLALSFQSQTSWGGRVARGAYHPRL